MTAKYDPFVNLHLHTDASPQDGLHTVDEVVERCLEAGQTAFAVTDHGIVSAHWKAYQAAKKAGLKFLPGQESYLIHDVGVFKSPEATKEDKKNSHCTMIALNNKGLEQLWTLSSLGFIEGLYDGKGHIDWRMLKEVLGDNNNNLIGTSGCMMSYISRAIVDDDIDQVQRLIGMYLDAFGEGNFYFELHTWQIIEPSSEKHHKLNQDMTKINQTLAWLSKMYGIPCIAVTDCHYSRQCDAEDHSIMWDMSIKKSDQTENGLAADWMMTSDEVRHWLSQHGLDSDTIEEAILNTRRIADRAENIEIDTSIKLPKVTDSIEKDVEMFDSLMTEGLIRKVLNNPRIDPSRHDEYIERAQYERDVIVGKGFQSYFLVVRDYYLWAKKQGWLLSSNRGSSGGSLACLLLDINEIDPIEYGLIFERFLNPDRQSWPDIDGDFPQSKRGELLNYLREKYGFFNVAIMGTTFRMKVKSLVKDLSRAMRIPHADANAISKLLNKHSDFTPEGEDENDQREEWGDFLDSVGPELGPWMQKYPEMFAKIPAFLHRIRQYGAHASGIIISDEPLLGKLPLRVKVSKDSAGLEVRELVTQFESSESYGTDLEQMGYIKYDILGLRHLDTLMETDRMVFGDADPSRFYGMSEEIEDPEIYRDMAAGRAVGVFQCDTNSCLPVLKRYRPQSERDLSVVLASNRPSAINSGALERLLRRREGNEEVKYVHPMLESILKETAGEAIYQEQVLQIFRDLAQYTMAESDLVRRAIGKKSKAIMDAQKEKFIEGCLSNPEFVEACREI